MAGNAALLAVVGGVASALVGAVAVSAEVWVRRHRIRELPTKRPRRKSVLRLIGRWCVSIPRYVLNGLMWALAGLSPLEWGKKAPNKLETLLSKLRSSLSFMMSSDRSPLDSGSHEEPEETRSRLHELPLPGVRGSAFGLPASYWERPSPVEPLEAARDILHQMAKTGLKKHQRDELLERCLAHLAIARMELETRARAQDSVISVIMRELAITVDHAEKRTAIRDYLLFLAGVTCSTVLSVLFWVFAN